MCRVDKLLLPYNILDVVASVLNSSLQAIATFRCQLLFTMNNFSRGNAHVGNLTLTDSRVGVTGVKHPDALLVLIFRMCGILRRLEFLEFTCVDGVAHDRDGEVVPRAAVYHMENWGFWLGLCMFGAAVASDVGCDVGHIDVDTTLIEDKIEDRKSRLLCQLDGTTSYISYIADRPDVQISDAVLLV